MKLLILELDDTIVELKQPDSRKPRKRMVNVDGEWTYTNDSASTKPDVVVPDNVYEKLHYYKKNDWHIIVCTNQPLVAQGKRTIDQVNGMFFTANYLLGEILDGLVICPHAPDATVEPYRIECKCRKPQVGMVTLALGRLGSSLEQLEDCIVVGPNTEDLELAIALNARYRDPKEFF